MPILRISARIIYDSLGYPTLEVDLRTDAGEFSAAVPSEQGQLVESQKAETCSENNACCQLRRILKAVSDVNVVIRSALVNARLTITDQRSIDCYLVKLSRSREPDYLERSAILGVSLAVARAAASQKKIPLYEHIRTMAGSKTPYVLPVPCMSILNGAATASGPLPYREIMLTPLSFMSFTEAACACSEIYHTMQGFAKRRFGPCAARNICDNGALSPVIEYVEDALDLVVDAIESSGYAKRVKIAINFAGCAVRSGRRYQICHRKSKAKVATVDIKQLAEYYWHLVDTYPIVSVEDPLSADDWESWTYLHSRIGAKVQLVSDDLTLSSEKLVIEGVEKSVANATIVKLSQVRTLTEAVDTAVRAFDSDWAVKVSHSPGETVDAFIADMVVGLRSGQLKCGAPARSEHLSKVNQILRIEEDLRDMAIYAGAKFHKSVGM